MVGSGMWRWVGKHRSETIRLYLSENRAECKQKILVDAFLADNLLGKDGGMRENRKQ
jgi:hypothetical protein